MEKLKVKDHPDLVRDPRSGAIINENSNSYKNYIESYKRKMQEQSRLEGAIEDINNLKEEVSEIKNLLIEILKKV
jgi:hypothetical protein